MTIRDKLTLSCDKAPSFLRFRSFFMSIYEGYKIAYSFFFMKILFFSLKAKDHIRSTNKILFVGKGFSITEYS
ncbi:hypothetical protein STHERM_c03790 [Spirochaeta thermophila DSM 6192]|uniref:Uncharacterized protein n=1 Tax=Winmispira thermophila (strain ATCC 49972 / DSM 6192 / RI 19.B1) TaxID=665571 RepID=E0RPN7_WINT6|nr:hypothetical protein STHERM_c03790 [Spirochaeta thermophila DSM 6192]